MSIIFIIIAIIIGLAENAKDAHDVAKWRNSGGMAKDWDCWKNKK